MLIDANASFAFHGQSSFGISDNKEVEYHEIVFLHNTVHSLHLSTDSDSLSDPRIYHLDFCSIRSRSWHIRRVHTIK